MCVLWIMDGCMITTYLNILAFEANGVTSLNYTFLYFSSLCWGCQKRECQQIRLIIPVANHSFWTLSLRFHLKIDSLYPKIDTVLSSAFSIFSFCFKKRVSSIVNLHIILIFEQTYFKTFVSIKSKNRIFSYYVIIYVARHDVFG